MDNIKWINVIQLKEFFNASSTQDLNELSMSSKLFRSKLIPVIYKTLKINDLTIKKLGYKDCRITVNDSEYNNEDIQEIILGWNWHYRRGFFGSEDSYYSDDEEFKYQIDIFVNPYKPLTETFIASREKFQSDIKLIPYQPSVLIINNVRNHCYLIRELSTVFNNLSSLDIHSIRVTLEDLQYLLDNLNCLEHLQFTFNYIFKYYEGTIDSSINWPQTLKKLFYGRNREMAIDNRYDPIPIHPHENHPDIPRIQHLLSPTHLPNLESLSLLSFDNEFTDRLEFLKVNPQITILSLFFVKELQEVFDVIQQFNNLEHLLIIDDSSSYEKELESINSRIPSNLKKLTISINYYDHITQFLNKSFLQITDLSVRFKSIQFHQLILLISNLAAMHLLKKLELHFEVTSEFYEVNNNEIYKSYGTNIIEFPKLDNLETVEFKLISNSNYNIKMDLSKLKLIVDDCSKLKYIWFRSEDNLKHFGEIGSNKLELSDSWKLISTPRKYLLYRTSQ